MESNPSEVWTYTLLPGSQLIDKCPPCMRLDTVVPMQGTFQLRWLEENPLFSTYALEFVAFDAGQPPGTSYTVRGQGIYQVGGEVMLLQDLFLEVDIDSGWTNRRCYFTNGVRTITRPWPSIQVSVDQTNGLDVQQFHLDLIAAPVREIWFSTKKEFHAAIWNSPTNLVSAGDLISSAGRVVKRNQELTRYLGIEPVVPDLGLKDVDVLPGAEIAFSIETDVWSETLGRLLQHGDLLSSRGRILRTNQDLIAAFVPMPPVADMGLDAVQVLSNGEIYFSVQKGFFSSKLGRTVRRGDLLSSRGSIVKTNEALIAKFNPAFPNQDYGLKAIYVWPSGEMWFSTEDGFYGAHFDYYAPGDLLSDQGYVVYGNLELLAAFKPTEKLTDFGLDALFVVSDVRPSPATPARCTAIKLEPSTGALTLQWEGPGAVFQVERATNVLGPYLPMGPIIPDVQFTDAGALTNQPQAFYRIRQW